MLPIQQAEVTAAQAAQAAQSAWSTEQAALMVLIAIVASAVIGIVIMTPRPRSFVYAALVGVFGGVTLRLTPGGAVAAKIATGSFVWIGQPVIGALFALIVAAIFELLLSPNVPVLRHVRSYGRRALRPWRWGTALEIAERAGVASWMPGLLGLGVEPRPLTAPQLVARARIIASVLCGSCVGVAFVVPGFLHVLVETLTPGHILITAIATAVVTFLLGPLHEEILQLTGRGHAPQHTVNGEHGNQWRLVPNVVIFVVTAVLLTLLQAVHTAVHKQIETLDLYQWILLIELSALPLIVTTYFFGSALHRTELGEARWDRALEASIFVGAVALAPFAITYLLSEAFPQAYQDSLFVALTETGPAGRILVLILVTALVTILAGIVAAVVASGATYGVYAAALGLAMSGATRANARWRACIAVFVAGVIAQGLTSLAIWWLQLKIPILHYIHPAVATGWALGLLASRFQDEVEDEVTVPAAQAE